MPASWYRGCGTAHGSRKLLLGSPALGDVLTNDENNGAFAVGLDRSGALSNPQYFSITPYLPELPLEHTAGLGKALVQLSRHCHAVVLVKHPDHGLTKKRLDRISENLSAEPVYGQYDSLSVHREVHRWIVLIEDAVDFFTQLKRSHTVEFRHSLPR